MQLYSNLYAFYAVRLPQEYLNMGVPPGIHLYIHIFMAYWAYSQTDPFSMSGQ